MPLSYGKNFLHGVKMRILTQILFLLVLSTGCTLVHQRDVGKQDKGAYTEVDGEVRQVSDQASVEELRKNIPQQKRIENDQLKEILSLMGEVKEEPNRIRSRFNKVMRKRREVFRRDHRRKRDDFSKAEKKTKSQFLKSLYKERDEFKKQKGIEREERKEFFAKQDLKRKDFFADLRDKRKDFESEMSQVSKDFNAEVREHTRHFQQEYRAYSKRYRDWKKEQRKKKSQLRKSSYMRGNNGNGKKQLKLTQEQIDDLKVFQSIKNIKGQKLEARDN